MPRFELHLFTISEGDEGIKSSESKAMCWVKDSGDMEEIEDVSDKVISENIENNPDLIMFGTASIKVKGQLVMTLSFRNDSVDEDKMNSVLDLIASEEETIH
tara:strand:- start:2486 stop:2791 length:306 start_codon:yes stop_codon:yes gene_type:complete